MSVSRLIVIVGMSLLVRAAAYADESAEKFLGRTAAQYEGELKSDSAQSRHLAAWSLAQMGAAAEEALAAALPHDDPTVRYWAVHGLSRIALSSPAGSPLRKKLADALAPLLQDQSASPRVAAAETLARLGRRDAALPVLVHALADPQEAARIAAIDALSRLGPLAAAAKPEIEKAAADSSEYVKRIAARMLKDH